MILLILPENENFERVSRSIEVLYSGAKVLGTDTMLKMGTWLKICQDLMLILLRLK